MALSDRNAGKAEAGGLEELTIAAGDTIRVIIASALRVLRE